MSKNPLVSALVALGYIVMVAGLMFYGSEWAEPEDTIIAPIAAMSIFTLSAAVMGYLFLYQPIQLYFANKKKESIELFLKTVLMFGGITILLVFVMFSGVLNGL